MTTPFDSPQAELAWMFLQSMCEGGDTDEGFGLLSEAFTYWNLADRTVLDKTALRRVVEGRGHGAGISLDLVRCVNDGGNVVVEAQAYGDPIVFIFEIGAGVIVSLHEYGDPRAAARAFARSRQR